MQSNKEIKYLVTYAYDTCNCYIFITAQNKENLMQHLRTKLRLDLDKQINQLILNILSNDFTHNQQPGIFSDYLDWIIKLIQSKEDPHYILGIPPSNTKCPPLKQFILDKNNIQTTEITYTIKELITQIDAEDRKIDKKNQQNMKKKHEQTNTKYQNEYEQLENDQIEELNITNANKTPTQPNMVAIHIDKNNVLSNLGYHQFAIYDKNGTWLYDSHNQKAIRKTEVLKQLKITQDELTEQQHYLQQSKATPQNIEKAIPQRQPPFHNKKTVEITVDPKHPFHSLGYNEVKNYPGWFINEQKGMIKHYTEIKFKQPFAANDEVTILNDPLDPFHIMGFNRIQTYPDWYINEHSQQVKHRVQLQHMFRGENLRTIPYDNYFIGKQINTYRY